MERRLVKGPMGDFLLVSCSHKELRKLNASDFPHGSVIHVGKYYIFIKYKGEDREYRTPALLSYVETEDGKCLDCFPGSSKGFTPYYIDEFKGR